MRYRENKKGIYLYDSLYGMNKITMLNLLSFEKLENRKGLTFLTVFNTNSHLSKINNDISVEIYKTFLQIKEEI